MGILTYSNAYKERQPLNTIYSRQNPPPGFYIYAYISKKGNVYYIGKGNSGRAWITHKNHGVNKPPNNSNIIIMECNLTEIGALALERFYIRWYGRKDMGTGSLLNKTDGGEGTIGHKHNDVTKNKMSKSHKERALNQDYINNMYGRSGNLSPTYGMKRPDLSERNKSLEKRLATSKALKGKPKSEAHKQAMRDAKRGKKGI
jgi:hypothetical protein